MKKYGVSPVRAKSVDRAWDCKLLSAACEVNHVD